MTSRAPNDGSARAYGGTTTPGWLAIALVVVLHGSALEACGGPAALPDAGAVLDAGTLLDAGTVLDAGRVLDAAPRDGGSSDGAVSDASLAEFMRTSPTVHASGRVEARVGGAQTCASATERTCLEAPCEHAAGCVYFGELTYTSTPASGTSGPPLEIRAQYFQFAAEGSVPGHAPVMILNHGGTELGETTVTFALGAVARGYAVMASTYRGSGGADGVVEGCLGESDDVRILAELVRDAAPSDPRAMVGGSHGGCVTLAALAAGAPIDVAVALWPGTDGARRYRYNHAAIAVDGELTAAATRCTGMSSMCCNAVRRDLGFVRDGLVAPADVLGALPDWQTIEYACDDPAFAATPSPWIGDVADREPFFCDRAPLRRAATFAAGYDGPLLVIHGERDPYIHYTESCEFARQQGDFAVHRIDDTGAWIAPGGETPCVTSPITAGEDPAWTGPRHLVLVEPLGHGDPGRSSTFDSCELTSVASPSVDAMLYAFLERKLAP